ncbi:MAG: paraquat-inducible protein A [Paracoccaceae bacterium]
MKFRPIGSAPPWLAFANLALLALYPVAWAAPLAHAGVLPFFSGSELTILGGVRDLWSSDPILAVIVALFAIVAPYLKALALAAIHFGVISGRRWLGLLEQLARFAMADVFLLALYIIAVKGVGVGYISTAWGLWFFTGLVIASLAIAGLTRLSSHTEQGLPAAPR